MKTFLNLLAAVALIALASVANVAYAGCMTIWCPPAQPSNGLTGDEKYYVPGSERCYFAQLTPDSKEDAATLKKCRDVAKKLQQQSKPATNVGVKR